MTDQMVYTVWTEDADGEEHLTFTFAHRADAEALVERIRRYDPDMTAAVISTHVVPAGDDIDNLMESLYGPFGAGNPRDAAELKEPDTGDPADTEDTALTWAEQQEIEQPLAEIHAPIEE